MIQVVMIYIMYIVCDVCYDIHNVVFVICMHPDPS